MAEQRVAGARQEAEKMRLELAAQLKRDGRDAEARAVVSEILEKVPETSKDALRAIKMGADLGLTDEVWAFADRILESQPDNADALLLTARLAFRRSREKPEQTRAALILAENRVRALLALRPTDARGFSLLGLILGRRGRLQESVEAWRCAQVLKPTDLDLKTGLAVALCNASRYREAVPYFSDVARRRRDSPDAHVNLGLALRESGELEQALEAFKQASVLRRDSPRVHLDIGITLRGLGRTAESVEAFEQAIRLDPVFADAHHQLGRVFLRLGRREEAEYAVQYARQLAPQDPAIERTLLELSRRPSDDDEITVAMVAPNVPDMVVDLSEFTVAEVLEFLGLGRRSGLVTVTNDTLSASMELLEGRVLVGQVVGYPSLVEKLVEAQLVRPEHAKLEFTEGVSSLLEGALENHPTSRADIEQVVFSAASDVVLSLLELKEGKVEFRSYPAGAQYDAKLTALASDMQGVLLEAHRRFDERLSGGQTFHGNFF